MARHIVGPHMQKGCLKKVRLAEVCRISWGPRDSCVLGQGSVGLGAMPAMGMEGFPW